MSDSPAQQTAKTVADRAALRAISERRWRVWINISVFVLVTTSMVLLSMAQRDYQSVKNCHDRLSYTYQELEKLLARGEVAPLSLPLPRMPEPPQNASSAERDRQERENLITREHYFYNLRYAAPQSERRTVGVCCCQRPHHLYLREDGRHVVVFDGQRYALRWMTEPEFRGQAATLSLTLPEER